ncbi:SDR family oxidoreductase [bacterium]|nr:SDR family oxidoreductase [bacterium]MBU1883793.1 SDR family oxidoreductase [bacterium]
MSKYRDDKINIIFNNFQTATQINSLENASEYIMNSILVTANVLEYFNKTSINKIIYTSSSSVYGNNILCNEKDEVKPMHLHASLKVANEKLIEQYCDEHNIDYTIARIFNMYGSNDRFSIISKILDAFCNYKELTTVNNGNAIRDFIHIDDVVSVYLQLLNTQNVKILNIGTGNGSSIKNILDFLSNNGMRISTKNILKDELKASTADIRLLSQIVDTSDFIDVQEYLKKELDVCRK